MPGSAKRLEPVTSTEASAVSVDQPAPDTLRVVTASIAHEVNQPLSAILTNASACLRMLSSEPPNLDGARETARRTIRDVNRAADVVDRLRALFARTAIAMERVDLNDTVVEALAMLSGELDKSQVSVKCALADGLPALIGDRVQLQQVVLNLVRNASEAMVSVQHRPRELVITTNREFNAVQLCVRDVGIGFRPRDADKLFAPFYTTKPHGMGIGLSVSRSIVESHRGRLWGIPNPDGQGATFSMSIPCRAPHASSESNAVALANGS